MSFHANITKTETTVTVSWLNGIGPFVLERSPLITGTFSPIDRPTMAQSKTMPIEGDQRWFRVVQAVPMLDLDETAPDTTLIWGIPDLE